MTLKQLRTLRDKLIAQVEKSREFKTTHISLTTTDVAAVVTALNRQIDAACEADPRAIIAAIDGDDDHESDEYADRCRDCGSREHKAANCDMLG